MRLLELAVDDDMGSGRTHVAIEALLPRRGTKKLGLHRNREAVADGHGFRVLPENHHAGIRDGPGGCIGGMGAPEAVFEPKLVGTCERLVIEQVTETLAELVVLVVADNNRPIADAERVAIVLS